MSRPFPASAAVVGLLPPTSLKAPCPLLPRFTTSVEDPAIPLRQVDGLEDVDVDRILDHPPRVARREVDVRDEGVAAIRWIDLAGGPGEDLLVLADLAER